MEQTFTTAETCRRRRLPRRAGGRGRWCAAQSYLRRVARHWDSALPALLTPSIVVPATCPVYSVPPAVNATSVPLSLAFITGAMTLPVASVPVKVWYFC